MTVTFAGAALAARLTCTGTAIDSPTFTATSAFEGGGPPGRSTETDRR